MVQTRQALWGIPKRLEEKSHRKQVKALYQRKMDNPTFAVWGMLTPGKETIMVQIGEEWFVFATVEALSDVMEQESPWSAENPYKNRLLMVNDTLYYGTD